MDKQKGKGKPRMVPSVATDTTSEATTLTRRSTRSSTKRNQSTVSNVSDATPTLTKRMKGASHRTHSRDQKTNRSVETKTTNQSVRFPPHFLIHMARRLLHHLPPRDHSVFATPIVRRIWHALDPDGLIQSDESKKTAWSCLARPSHMPIAGRDDKDRSASCSSDTTVSDPELIDLGFDHNYESNDYGIILKDTVEQHGLPDVLQQLIIPYLVFNTSEIVPPFKQWEDPPGNTNAFHPLVADLISLGYYHSRISDQWHAVENEYRQALTDTQVTDMTDTMDMLHNLMKRIVRDTQHATLVRPPCQTLLRTDTYGHNFQTWHNRFDPVTIFLKDDARRRNLLEPKGHQHHVQFQEAVLQLMLHTYVTYCVCYLWMAIQQRERYLQRLWQPRKFLGDPTIFGGSIQPLEEWNDAIDLISRKLPDIMAMGELSEGFIFPETWKIRDRVKDRLGSQSWKMGQWADIPPPSRSDTVDTVNSCGYCTVDNQWYMSRSIYPYLPSFVSRTEQSRLAACSECKSFHSHGTRKGHRSAHCDSSNHMSDYVIVDFSDMRDVLIPNDEDEQQAVDTQASFFGEFAIRNGHLLSFIDHFPFLNAEHQQDHVTRLLASASDQMCKRLSLINSRIDSEQRRISSAHDRLQEQLLQIQTKMRLHLQDDS